MLLKKGKIYLVGEMWWNHLDSSLHSFYFIIKSASLIIRFNMSDKLFLHSSLQV